MTTPSILSDVTTALDDTCPNCLYWDRHGGDPYGVCRANPPTGNGWPRTSRDDWCGHWEAAPVPPPPPAPEPKPVAPAKQTKKKT